VTLLAPLVTYLLVFASGTQHVIYALPSLQSVRDGRDSRTARRRSRSFPAAPAGILPGGECNLLSPTYGTVLAAVAFDPTGTTRIGRYVLNHSFMRPALAATGTATTAVILLARRLLA
jgi:anaerobic C4-dicarboxylate transporter